MKAQLNMEGLIKKLREVLKSPDKPVPLHEPCLGSGEWNHVKKCIDTGWVSSVGKHVDQFERKLVEFTGIDHAVAVVNGTAALHLSLKLMGISPGDEVLVPALTFVATANAVAYCGAVPHFVDSETVTLGIDPHRLEEYLKKITYYKGGLCYNKVTQRPIKALIVMHTFGHPVDLAPLSACCHAYGLELIEDAAEALGSFYQEKHVGHWGRVTALSFNGNKIVTTGGGGALLTGDRQVAERARHLSTTAKRPHSWAFFHDEVAYNYRLPNINAALGCGQMEQINEFLNSKRRLAYRYHQALEGVEGISFFSEPPHSKSNYWLNAMLLDESLEHLQGELLGELHRAGILARPPWTPLNQLPMYRGCPSMNLTVAPSLAQRIINLPSSSTLGGGFDA